MNKYQWYRKWSGGFWIRFDFVGWHKVSYPLFCYWVERGMVGQDWQDWTR